MIDSPLSAAKRICQESSWKVSNLVLQKLLYIAHMLHLGNKGTPLITGQFEAWDYGPVHPDVYRKTNIFGASPIQNIFRTTPDMEATTAKEKIDKVLDGLGKENPSKLVAITHWEGGAWAKNYKPGIKFSVIPNADIRSEYKKRFKKNDG